jgi:hypothetical protein
VFSYLNPCFSTCLGLTCKKFYSLHRSIHGTVHPTELDFRAKGRPCFSWYRGIMLWEYLVEWAAPKIWLNRERWVARYVACNVELEEALWRMRQALLQERVDKIGRAWIDWGEVVKLNSSSWFWTRPKHENCWRIALRMNF